jgi:hypothetical protein
LLLWLDVFIRPAKAQSNGMKGKNMASEGNMKAAEETYAGFLGVVKWGSVAAIAVTALVILLIS